MFRDPTNTNSCEKKSLPFSPSYLLSLDIEVHLTRGPGNWRLGEAGGGGRQIRDGGCKVVGGRSGGRNC